MSIQNPFIKQIIQSITEFKPKHSLVKQVLFCVTKKLLSYFKQSLKHPEIQLFSHFKILFELIDETESATIHISLLSLFNKAIDKSLIPPKSFHLVEEYFRSLKVMEDQMVNLKMIEVFITMVEKVTDNEGDALVEIVKLMGIVVEELDQKIKQKCYKKIVSCLEGQESEIERFVIKISEEIRKENGENQGAQKQQEENIERFFDGQIVTELMLRLYTENCSKTNPFNEATKAITPSLLRLLCSPNTQQPTFLSKQIKETIFKLLITISKTHPQHHESIIQSATTYSLQNNNIQFVTPFIINILNQSPSPNLNSKILQWVGKYQQHPKLSDTSALFIYNILNNILDSKASQSSDSSVDTSLTLQQQQLDQTKSILLSLRPILKNFQQKNKNTKQWESLFDKSLRLCFLYRIQIPSYLKLLRSSKNFFENIVMKYESYFEETEYCVAYQIIYKEKWSDFYHTKVIKPEVHLKALNLLILKAVSKNDSSLILFCVKQIKRIADICQGIRVVPNIEQACCQLFSLGVLPAQKLILDLIVEFLIRNQQWFRFLGKLYDLTQNIQLRMDTLQIINRLLIDSGDFDQSVWLSILLILNQTFQVEDQALLSKTLQILETIIHQYLHSLNKDLIHKTVKILIEFPLTQSSSKDKYIICGLLWTLGQKHYEDQLEGILKRLGQLCLDNTPEVAINSLCIYSELGNYQQYQTLFAEILSQSKQTVIISYLQNFVKIVKRTYKPDFYESISEMQAHYFPQLYQIVSNDIYIESTNCHKQLTTITLKQIFDSPEYYQLTLFFYINFLSQKPKELKLVRYSIPRMILELASEMVMISSHAKFNQSILVDTTIKLITKMVKYPMLANGVFNIDKNKIYFEEVQMAEHLTKYYYNLKEKDLFTPILSVFPLNRDVMINHSIYLEGEHRLGWLEKIGKPLNKQEMKRYAEIFVTEQELEFINSQESWGLREYLITQGKLTGNIDRSEAKISSLDFALCSYDSEDSQQTIERKRDLVVKLISKVKDLLDSSDNNEEIVSVLTKLNELEIHPSGLQIQTLSVKSSIAHLYHLSPFLLKLSLNTQDTKLQQQLLKITETMIKHSKQQSR